MFYLRSQFALTGYMYVLYGTDQDIIFSGTWMVRNGNSLSANFSEDTIKTIRTTLVSALYRHFAKEDRHTRFSINF